MEMAEQEPTQGSGINYGVVGFGIIILVLVVAAIPDTFLRVLAAAAIMLVTFWWSQSRQEPDVENPLMEQLHEKQYGLDRRKYGHLRSSTDNLLDHVRQMNRIAIEGREGKLAPRHAQAELDRLAAKMRDVVDDIRKTAGIPTPMDSATRDKSAQPEIVIPRAAPGTEGETTAPARPAPRPPREKDEVLDDLEEQARAEARRRKPEGGGA
jgi:hypothetical protein